MYEDVTFGIILERMLNKVLEQNNNIDTREGSIIYNALAPAAVELQNMYIELDVILNESFADTQSRDYLIKRCSERGIIPEAATKAIVGAEFNIDVPVGARLSLNDLNYIALEKVDDGIFELECETPGIEGNKTGTLIPINYIDGLETAEITEILIPGEDEEETEVLRRRYFDRLNTQAFGGNVADYKEKINMIAGVGGVKVYPAWNGGGTVKTVIIDSSYNVPSSTLIDAVQTAVDPATNQGKGVGFAPIGHVVTVAGVTSTTVNIATNITYQDGWDWEAVKTYVQVAIDKYFTELSAGWDEVDYTIVRISQIETRLLNLTGVLDIEGTTLNGASSNLALDKDSIPIRGAING